MTGALADKSVLVTGGTGFIGGYLVKRLLEDGARVTVLSRRPLDTVATPWKIAAGDLARPASVDGVCRGIDVVFHLAGHAHAFDHTDEQSYQENRSVTIEGTRALLEQALQSGVGRFIFVSSVKAMGEGGDARLDESAPCSPATGYGKAKREAERLIQAAEARGLSATVLRLPMVYGPGGQGNLTRMIRMIARGRFPPIPDSDNRRSMVDVRDVVEAMLLCAKNPVAAGQIYIVTDNQMYSTRQIYEWICQALSRSAPRWTVPWTIWRLFARTGDVAGRLLGRRVLFDSQSLSKLTGSAWYSSERIMRELDYRPRHQLKSSLLEMIRDAGLQR